MNIGTSHAISTTLIPQFQNTQIIHPQGLEGALNLYQQHSQQNEKKYNQTGMTSNTMSRSKIDPSQLVPKWPMRKKIITLNRKEKLQKMTQEIQRKEEQIINRGIQDAMKHYYGHFEKPVEAKVFKYKDMVFRQTEVTASRNQLPHSQDDHKKSVMYQTGQSPLTRKNSLIQKEKKTPAAEKVHSQEQTKKFLNKNEMGHRMILRSQDQKQRNPLKLNVDSEKYLHITDRSNLKWLTNQDIREQNQQMFEYKRANMVRQAKELSKQSTGNLYDSTLTTPGFSLKSPKSERMPQFMKNEENMKMMDHCKKISNNAYLYAETILVNARTGKRVKEMPTLPRKMKRDKNVFQHYQDNLFQLASNQQIAHILHQSKKYQLSQFKEDFGIAKYIKDKFLQDFVTADGSEISTEKLEEIK